MTDEERRMLREIHAALFAVPPGSRDAQPLIEDVRVVVRAYQRASWATRALVWLLPSIAGVGIAIEKIRSWFQ